MDPFQTRLKDRACIILDGALASELETTHGKDLSGSLWSAKLLYENAECIKDVHLSYYKAGATTTATYQASFSGFEKAGFGRSDAEKLMQRAIQLACEARSEYMTERIKLHAQGDPLTIHSSPPLIAASLGCYGAHLSNGAEFTGDYGNATDEMIYAFHLERLEAILGKSSYSPELPGGGGSDTGTGTIDILAFETIPLVQEARVIERLLRREGVCGTIPAWVSFCCRDGRCVSSGEMVQECVRELFGGGVDGSEQGRSSGPSDPPKKLGGPGNANGGRVVAVGVNCTAPKYVGSLLGECKAALDPSRPATLLCYPNSGESFDSQTQSWYWEGDGIGGSGGSGGSVGGREVDAIEDFGALADIWVNECGARAVGGCCRTTPAHIKNLAERF
ncbi:hypothetical protein HK102_001519, partial [Quaeritorhiza haematococci]